MRSRGARRRDTMGLLRCPRRSRGLLPAHVGLRADRLRAVCLRAVHPPESVSMGQAVRDLAPCVVLGRVPGERRHLDSRSPGPPGESRRARGRVAGRGLPAVLWGDRRPPSRQSVSHHARRRRAPIDDRAGRVAAIALAGGDRSPWRPLPSRRAPPDSDRAAAALRRVSRHRRVGVAAARRCDGAAIRHLGWLGRPDGHRLVGAGPRRRGSPGRVCRRQPGGVDRGHTAAGLRVGIRLRRGARRRRHHGVRSAFCPAVARLRGR